MIGLSRAGAMMGAALALLVVAAGPARAQLAVGAHGSSVGFGPDVEYMLGNYLTIAGAGDWLELPSKIKSSDLTYKDEIQLRTADVFADIHPLGDSVFVSAGGYFGDRQAQLKTTPVGTFKVGGTSYTPDEVGELKGDIRNAHATPFLGLGMDSTNRNDENWGLRVLVGLTFSRPPNVDLSATGSSAAAPDLQASLVSEEKSLRDRSGLLAYDPVFSLGTTYHF